MKSYISNASDRKKKELVMYTVMGVSATIVNWCVYSILVPYTNIAFANALSWLITLVFAFVTNKIYVFDSRSWDKHIVIKEMISFTTARGITGFLEVFLQPQLYAMGLNQSLFGVDGLVAKITVCLSLVIVNYFSTKLIVFRRTEPGHAL
ncbi:MAG: GtrA family protein [Lachnospiraceae bacterium]|nr:GtrA family protein [Lachnospiraceae bacterium]